MVGVPDSKTNRSETLTRVPIFAGLTEGELSFLAERTVQRRFSAGETVFAEGESCAGLFVVESGHVRIFKSSAGGREQVLSIEGPGSSVAELPVLTGATIQRRSPQSTTRPCFSSASRTFSPCASLTHKFLSKCCVWLGHACGVLSESSRSSHSQRFATDWPHSL
jgi:CRP-like cAMP-binding protein